MEYSLINLEKNEFSLSSSLAGESYSAILPAHGKIRLLEIDAEINVVNFLRLVLFTITQHQD